MRTKNLGLVCIFGMIALLALGGCAGMQVRIGDGGKEILAEEAGFELGIYLGRKQPAAIPALQDFITAMEAATPGTAPDVMGLLKHYVTGRLIEDPIGQARLNRGGPEGIGG